MLKVNLKMVIQRLRNPFLKEQLFVWKFTCVNFTCVTGLRIVKLVSNRSTEWVPTVKQLRMFKRIHPKRCLKDLEKSKRKQTSKEFPCGFLTVVDVLRWIFHLKWKCRKLHKMLRSWFIKSNPMQKKFKLLIYWMLD